MGWIAVVLAWILYRLAVQYHIEPLEDLTQEAGRKMSRKPLTFQ